MNKLLAIGAIIALIGLGVMLAVEWPTPLTDANRQVLAETKAEAYCAGEVFGQTRGKGDEASMQTCLEDASQDDEPRHEAVQYQFCLAFGKVTGFPLGDCVTIMKASRYWPTMIGTITNAWNKSFPYPLDAVSSGTGADSRTQDRDTNEREGGFRP